MVVLTEEFHGGLSLKRKGAHEPGLFDVDAGATKMRRLACPDGPRGGADQAVTAAWEDDVAMGDAAPAATSPSPSDDGRAVVVYRDGDGESVRGSCSSRRIGIDAPRLALRDGTGAGADWIRAMLREADSRTVRQLLAGAAKEHGTDPDLALAVVPWVAPAPAEAEAEDGDDREAAMDVEGDDEPRRQESRTWTGHGQVYDAVAAEGLVYRWPQLCWAAVAQAGPVMWS
ncbi:hypothetical protein Zm00014a_026644 [Zea mays]|uniref:Uncharacterized protein n=1 Tax=Zea mays TaxID=4577 RepID=A0A317YAD4_MAIZE|nr:hypothetical protein Zm00014a_026644 [Zea mays]